MAQILIVDDEAHIRSALSLLLSHHGHTVHEASSGEDAVRLAAAEPVDIVVLDYSLPGIDGLQTFRALTASGGDVTCIVMTAFGTIRNAIEAIRAGAFDYLTKPFDNDELLLAVQRAIELRRLANEVRLLRDDLETRYGFAEIVGISQPMQQVFRFLAKYARADDTVLILGESGTGKELAARAIHRRSNRSSGPFVAVNCSAIPATLVESEFFGSERGAFTDAKESRPGRFELAHGGVLFLDEVGDLPLDAQAKLLRVLEDREVTRLGGRRALPVDVRVISATNRDLGSLIATGRFREDLYYRLEVLTLTLPPLRERPEDVPLLIDHLLERLGSRSAVGVSGMSPEARRLLLSYRWPGNVRELENALRGAVALAESSVVEAIDLPARIRGLERTSVENSEQGTLAEAVDRATERVERAMIQAALMQTHGNRSKAAEQLGVNRKTLFNKAKAYGIVDDAADD